MYLFTLKPEAVPARKSDARAWLCVWWWMKGSRRGILLHLQQRSEYSCATNWGDRVRIFSHSRRHSTQPGFTVAWRIRTSVVCWWFGTSQRQKTARLYLLVLALPSSFLWISYIRNQYWILYIVVTRSRQVIAKGSSLMFSRTHLHRVVINSLPIST